MRFLDWFLLLFIFAFTTPRSVEAQNQAGFISLDCGLIPKNTTYVENTINITYKSDADYIDSGSVGKIKDAYKTQFQRQLWSLRSFPDGKRNCYNVNVTANSKYLIRGSFVYGNYDGLNQLPSFDLHIGPNKWSSVTIEGVANFSMTEIIHVVTQERLQVCLVKTGPTTPFISSLELRPLPNQSYVTETGSLTRLARVFFSTSSSVIRYEEDPNNQVWSPILNTYTKTISTDNHVDTSLSFYEVPQAVIRTAGVPANASEPWSIWWTLDETTQLSYVYMHFAEVQTLKANDIREFNITYNGGIRWYAWLRPESLKISSFASRRAMSSPDAKFNFTFTMTGNSTLPPLLNALEIYTVVDLLQLETVKDEVSAMLNIKKTYGLNKKVSWQGDPCVPQLYRWEGLNCSYPDSEPSRIISLNLNGSELNGTITSDISKLTQLIELDLSKNDLSGEIPAFFADMKLLKLINLSGNPKLNLTVPGSLQERINSKSLTLVDVYSFGVVLLEIVTNQPVIDKSRERSHINEWVGFMLTKGDIRSIIDPKLMGDYDTNGAWKIVELAMACVNPSSNQRPKMAHVVMELNECVALEIARRQGSQEIIIFEHLYNEDCIKGLGEIFNGYVFYLPSSSVSVRNDDDGFISLDCGLVPKNTTYVEKTTNITYKSDADYIDSGSAGKINDAYKTQFQQQLWSLRSFPDGQRNCYNVNVTANSKYLIRGSFVYGNYDGLNQLPSFDLHIGRNKWSSVTIVGVANFSMTEIIHVVTQERLQVCLVKTGPTTPFISSLELRPLKNKSYVTQTGSLQRFARIYFSSSSRVIRYDEDQNDQAWYPFLNSDTSTISTDLKVDTSNSFYEVPQAVIKTAGVPVNASEPWSIWWTLDETTQLSYVYMHFAEVQTLKANDIREFNITYNSGIRWYSWLRPQNLIISTIFNPRAISSSDGKFNFTFTMTGNSTLPPLLNALEIYTVVDILPLETDKDEVSAMINIKKTYGLRKKISWQGDPCVPQLYLWEGLNCSYPDSEPSRIISLNLNGSELIGTITSDISKLTQLMELDLSKNDLSGEIPAFFADMKLLKLINLSGNPKLNLTVPASLQERLNSKSLTLILGDTLNPTVKGKSSKSPVAAIAASVAGVFALVVILAIFFVVRKKKTKTNAAPGPPTASPGIPKSETRSSNPSIISKDRRITYSEVLKMTNNFERVLGKGGFGTVYHGNLDDAQVAVKMLSHSSAQGYKEFKAEVELLLRVHHRHLVGLVGYCDDGDNLALIYEYMANGDLRENTSGKRGGNVLTWENRMQIAVDSAQGLEYLHNGCRPPMVHRDVKTTNILLTERYGAKLADFGLSRSFPIDGECHVSTVVAGTPGYLDPEYYRTNWLSEKSDVYSFGVVLLEIVTNQPVIDKTRERPHINEWVGFMLTKGDIRSIIDPKLMGDYDTNGAWKIVELAMACVNPSSNQRPKMAHVVMELNECVALEIARRQGSQEMYSNNSVDFSLSEFAPGAR
ncbi:unnamed protein product [Brassica oleracea]